MNFQIVRAKRRAAASIGVLAFSFILVNPTPVLAQTSSSPRSPKDVLAEYRKIDKTGGRLTVDGWYQTYKFFVKPGRPPRAYILEVVDSEKLWDRPVPESGSNG